jgi:hypothetical protein
MTDRLEGRLLEGLADRYRIEREPGQGGMATVFLAQDLRHDRKVVAFVGEFDRDGNRPAWDLSPEGTRFVFTRSGGGTSRRAT